MKNLQWRDNGNQLVLYIINDQYPEGILYSACKTPGLYVADYDIPGGSKGFATMQNCLKLGYTLIQSRC